MIASISPGLIPWTLTGALALLGLAVMVAAVRILRAGDGVAGDPCEDLDESPPTNRSAPDVDPGLYLPPRDCQVLIIVDGEEVWADVEFTRVGVSYGWHFADTEKPLDPEQVVDWRECEVVS